MKKLVLALMISNALHAGTQIKTEALGYGGNEQIACSKARDAAKQQLLKLCRENRPRNIAFSFCKFENEGDYFVVFSVKAYAECI